MDLTQFTEEQIHQELHNVTKDTPLSDEERQEWSSRIKTLEPFVKAFMLCVKKHGLFDIAHEHDSRDSVDVRAMLIAVMVVENLLKKVN